MKNNRYARAAWLIIVITGLLSQITGCSLPPAATQMVDIASRIATDTAILPSVKVTYTPLPTRTMTLSPTQTSTRTPRPSLTVTPNQRETILALTDVYEKTVCRRYPDTWQMTVERSFLGGWCRAAGVKGSLYEYEVFYPSSWSVKTFGELYSHLLLVSGKPNIEIRVYQVFSYYTRKENFKLEDAPKKAAFYDLVDKPFPVVDPLEKSIKIERRTTLSHDVLVLDSELGEQVIRRYFFFVIPKPGLNAVKQLFYVQLTTLKSTDPAVHQDLIDKAEYIMTTVRPLPTE